MKRSILLLFAAVMTLSCNSQNKLKVNGEKVELQDGLYAMMSTSEGDILIRLEHTLAPMTVGNFVALAEGKMPNKARKAGEPFYDNTIFHRVIPNFMIQGGDPDGTGQGGPGYSFADEFDPSLKHSGPGILSMANAGPGTNGSQFFITHTATPHLDNRHSVFGKVINGQDIVVKIGNVAKGQADKPNVDVVLKKLSIVRVGKEAKAFDGLAAFEAGKVKAAEAQAKADIEKAKKAEEAKKEIEKLMGEAEITASGLGVIIKEKGNGPKPNEGQMVNVHYAGYLADGTLFDSSIKEIAQKAGIYNAQREPYAPFQLPYGNKAQVIEGWKEGIQMLSVGDKARLIIPPHLGYGERGAGGVIPPNAVLIFDVEIVSIAE